jgi:hypothetical protein
MHVLLVGSLLHAGCGAENSSDDYTMDGSLAQPGPGQLGSDASSADAGGLAPLPTPTDASGLPLQPVADAGAGMDALVQNPATDAGAPGVQGDTGVPIAVFDAGDGGLALADAASDASGDAAALPLPDYTKRGPYTVKQLLNQGMGTIANGDSALLPLNSSNDPSALTVYLPENAPAGTRFPLLTFGNGTFCSPTFYDELINHVVSHGFVVVAANTSTVGTGEPMIKALDWALAQNMQASSPLSGKIDPEQLGAFGHSQGGAGTCNAGLDARIDTIVPLSGVPLNQDAGTGTISKIKVPIFFVNTADEASGSTLIEDSFNGATAPAAYGVTISGNHDEYTDVVDDPGVPGLTSNDAKNSRAGIAAWFDWHLKAKSAARSLFVGPSCGFCAGSSWKSIKSKGF